MFTFGLYSVVRICAKIEHSLLFVKYAHIWPIQYGENYNNSYSIRKFGMCRNCFAAVANSASLNGGSIFDLTSNFACIFTKLNLEVSRIRISFH
jgi:hypothetical protein